MSEVRPYMIEDENAAGKQLPRLPAQKGVFEEEWLQELLYKHPAILPIEYLGDSFAPTIPIGREIANIDNLFISPEGLLTIVETKLWRNPEAHRTVVAQILDYARELAKWSFHELDEAVQDFMQKRTGKRKSIYTIVKSRETNLDCNEIEFEQRAQDCLDNGRFALAIVGDRIFPGATQLAETIQAAPHMQYTIGFFELRCYRAEKGVDWPLIVVPHIVAKTKEITRAVVKVVYEKEKPEVQISTPQEEQGDTGRTNFEEFIASLPSRLAGTFKSYMESWMQAGHKFFWGVTGFSLRVYWNDKPRALVAAHPYNVSILQERRVENMDLPEGLYEAYKKDLMNSTVIGSALTNDRMWINFDDLSEEDVDLLLKTTDKLAKAIHDVERSGP
jgi:hypothetical protein